MPAFSLHSYAKHNKKLYLHLHGNLLDRKFNAFPVFEMSARRNFHISVYIRFLIYCILTLVLLLTLAVLIDSTKFDMFYFSCRFFKILFSIFVFASFVLLWVIFDLFYIMLNAHHTNVFAIFISMLCSLIVSINQSCVRFLNRKK